MSIPVESLWVQQLSDPTNSRQHKPRSSGLTMVIDKGLGLHETEDLCLNASAHIDFLKMGFGTMVLYPRFVLENKLALYKKYNMNPYPGGTFFEVALHKGAVRDYIQTLKLLGISTVEISDGTLEIQAAERQKWIKTMVNEGFNVITEYGKKLSGSQIDVEALFETIESDLESGASFIIVEGRESGADVGLYDSDGEADLTLLNTILSHHSASRLMWEAPQKQQQVDLIASIGFDVSLGNIAPNDIFGTEALRRGLRSDTFSLLL